MTIRLRGHHLLCLLTYQGMGYTRAFTANYNRLIRRISAGEEIVLVDGPDDICTPLLCTPGAHCAGQQAIKNDAHTLTALSEGLNTPLKNGTIITLTADRVWQMRAAFVQGDIRYACHTCRWHDYCSDIARQKFTHTLLYPEGKVTDKS